MNRRIALAVVLLIALTGCAKKKRVTRLPVAPAAGAVHVGDEETGVASWYGHPYHGRPSSSGEIYDMEKLTAAHRTLPFGAMVRVQNLSNDRTVDVRINDRGPFVGGRVIDLSKAAAREIAMIGAGTAKVRLRIIALPDALPAGFFAVQIGAFRDRANADRERRRMAERYGAARLALRDGNPPVWRVLVGRADTMDAAGELAARVRSETGAAFIVRVDGPEAD